MYVLFIQYFIDLNKRIPDYSKNKKISLVKTEESILAAEVKYQNEIKKHDFAALYPFRTGIVISKDTLIHDDKYPVIPIHLALCLI